jgi:hypothetical protein
VPGEVGRGNEYGMGTDFFDVVERLHGGTVPDYVKAAWSDDLLQSVYKGVGIRYQ